MPESEVRIRVRYKETDNMGVVHHSNYVNYYEVARTAWALLQGDGGPRSDAARARSTVELPGACLL